MRSPEVPTVTAYNYEINPALDNLKALTKGRDYPQSTIDAATGTILGNVAQRYADQQIAIRG